jgi:NADPH-dependent glutamate synthase beta subunit-like oxidoreductase
METLTQNGHANGFANGNANGEANDRSNDYFPAAAGRKRQRKAVIVGAGPVGCLAAIALASKGWSVEVYEGRAGAACFSSTVTPLSGYS